MGVESNHPQTGYESVVQPLNHPASFAFPVQRRHFAFQSLTVLVVHGFLAPMDQAIDVGLWQPSAACYLRLRKPGI